MENQLKRFLLKFLIFASPILLLWIVEAFILPPDYFTYRLWESLQYASQVPHVGPFYPNTTIAMTEEGDLGHHTSKALLKHVIWKTDEWGFRNDSFIPDPDILIVGDSFMAGCGLSQEETLAKRLSAELGSSTKIYVAAPVAFSDIKYLFEHDILRRPKLLIFSIVERSVPRPLSLSEIDPLDISAETYTFKRKLYGWTGFDALYDKLTRFYSVEWAIARINGKHGNGITGMDHSMLFLQGKNSTRNDSARLANTTRNLLAYKKYCDLLHIRFLFLPMPNKETVYYDRIPLSKQPDYLFRLDSALTVSGVSTVNTLSLYNEAKKKGVMLYHPDDTHWNGNATQLVAKAVSQFLYAGLYK
jgi:hypothetical protein